MPLYSRSQRILVRVFYVLCGLALLAAGIPGTVVLLPDHVEPVWRLFAVAGGVAVLLIPVVDSARLRAAAVGVAIAAMIVRAVDQLVADPRFLVAVAAWFALAAGLLVMVTTDADRR